MGLAAELMQCVRGGSADHIRAFSQAAHEMEAAQDRWIAELRAAGVKAAHPDDGWVDRVNNSVSFCYPQFNDGAGIGDIIALGSAPWSFGDRTRLVRIVGKKIGVFSGTPRWFFEPV